MPQKREDYRLIWAILLLSGPLVLFGVFWNVFVRSETDKFFDKFIDRQVSVYRGYPLVVDPKQELFLKRNQHKVALKEPFYLEPIQVDYKKMQELVAFLRLAAMPESTGEEHIKACVFHADLLIEVPNYRSRPQLLVCSSCADVWIGSEDVRRKVIAINPQKHNELKQRVFDILIGSEDVRRKVIAINPQKHNELKQRVFDILGKPAEWPPELQE